MSSNVSDWQKYEAEWEDEGEDWEADYEKYGVLSEEEILARLPEFFRDPLCGEVKTWMAQDDEPNEPFIDEDGEDLTRYIRHSNMRVRLVLIQEAQPMPVQEAQP